MSTKRLKLKTSTMGVAIVGGKRSAITLPAGATLTVAPNSQVVRQRINVVWEGCVVELFEIDLKMRAEEA